MIKNYFTKKFGFFSIGICLYTLALTGCVTIPEYDMPNPLQTPTATVMNYNYQEHTIAFTWKYARVGAIDHKAIDYMFRDPRDPISVLPGKHLFVINSKFSSGLSFEGPSPDYLIAFYADIKLNEKYYIKMNVENDKLVGIWMEDSSGKNISGVQQGAVLPKPINIPPQAFIPPRIK